MVLSFPLTQSLEEEFLASTQKAESGCWLWRRYVGKDGYGRFKLQLAHRVSYRHFIGPIEKGLYVKKCPISNICVNPHHLSLTTHFWGFQEGSVPWHKGKELLSIRRPIEERFWEKVDKSGGPDACWIWQGTRNWDNYGFIKRPDSRGNILAHRLSFQIAFGDIPPGTEVTHSCDHPPCVNPQHLRAKTHKFNMEEAALRGRLGMKGEKHHRAKLTDSQVREMLKKLQTTPALVVAEEYGVSETTAWSIRERRTWKHIIPEDEMEE